MLSRDLVKIKLGLMKLQAPASSHRGRKAGYCLLRGKLLKELRRETSLPCPKASSLWTGLTQS